MLLELHTVTTSYVRYLRRDEAKWDDATARDYRSLITRLAASAGVTGDAFTRFVTRVTVQVVTA